MALAFVNLATGFGDTSASTVAAGAANHTAGNLIVVGVEWTHASRTLNSVTDTAGNTYTRVTGSKSNSPGGSDHMEIFYAKNISGNASNVITATFSGAVTFRRIFVHQYSGADTTAPLDQVAIGNTSSTTDTTASFTTTVADEVIVAFQSSDGVDNNVAPGTGYTQRGNSVGADSDSEDRIVAATGTYTASFTWGTAQNAWMSAASFKAAGGGGGSALTQNVDDSVTMSDAVALGQGKSLADSVTMSETVGIGQGKQVDDSVTMSDTVGLGQGKGFADSVTMADSATVERGINVSVNDSVTMSDTMAFGYGLGIGDTVSLADAVAFGYGLALSDSVTMSDSVTAGLAYALSVNDSVALADDIQLAQGVGWTVNVDDTLTLADAVAFGYGLALSDSVTLADSRSFGYGIGLADTVSLVDALMFGYGLSVDDAVALADHLNFLVNGQPLGAVKPHVRAYFVTKFGFYT